VKKAALCSGGIMLKTGWKNKGGTSERTPCRCGTWKQHWKNISGKQWPKECSVDGCKNPAEVGAHLWNPQVQGEKIVPFCKQCNTQGADVVFDLKDVELVSANRAETCEAKSISNVIFSKRFEGFR
jgi:hypothetical protein